VSCKSRRGLGLGAEQQITDKTGSQSESSEITQVWLKNWLALGVVRCVFGARGRGRQFKEVPEIEINKQQPKTKKLPCAEINHVCEQKYQ
jgi:hypothetical protein